MNFKIKSNSLALDNKNLKCRICNYKGPGIVLKTKEMMFGFRGVFYYSRCNKCGSASIRNIPKNMAYYYPRDYGSKHINPWYKNSIIMGLFKIYLSVNPNNYVRKAIDKRMGVPNVFQVFYNMLKESKYKSFRASTILDIGSGTGQWLIYAGILGFKKRLGVDMFVEHTIRYNKDFKILKGDLTVVKGKFDFILSNHSIEHIANPRTTFRGVRKLIKENGIFVVRTPLIDSYAFEKYGPNWVDLDPPRHLVLFTRKAMCDLAEKSGFEVTKIIYDSNAFQFSGSELYKHNLILNKNNYSFSHEEISAWDKLSIKLNSEKKGDQACFILRPN